MIYLELFYTFFVIGAFTFGGGYAMLSLIQNKVVIEHQWITAQEFTDIIAVSQMTPGPIGINSATYIGYTATGNVFGSFIATFAVMLPSFILVLIICRLFERFKNSPILNRLMQDLRPIIISLIAAACASLMTKDNFIDPISWILFLAAIFAGKILKINPIITILSGGAIGFILYYL